MGILTSAMLPAQQHEHQLTSMMRVQVKLLAPGAMPKRGKGGTLASRQSLLHSLVHIENWAIDLSWDIIARFGVHQPHYCLPKAFFDDFVQVGSRHSWPECAAKHWYRSIGTARMPLLTMSVPSPIKPVEQCQSATAISYPSQPALPGPTGSRRRVPPFQPVVQAAGGHWLLLWRLACTRWVSAAELQHLACALALPQAAGGSCPSAAVACPRVPVAVACGPQDSTSRWSPARCSPSRPRMPAPQPVGVCLLHCSQPASPPGSGALHTRGTRPGRAAYHHTQVGPAASRCCSRFDQKLDV